MFHLISSPSLLHRISFVPVEGENSLIGEKNGTTHVKAMYRAELRSIQPRLSVFSETKKVQID